MLRVFPNDTLVRIGTVIFNTITNQVVDLVVLDSTNANDLRRQPYITSRWMSPDPLAEKYYEISPYTYCANNPIKFIDPTGMTIDPVNEPAAQITQEEFEKFYSKFVIKGNGKDRSIADYFVASKNKDRSFSYNKIDNTSGLNADLQTIKEQYNLSDEQFADLTAMTNGIVESINNTDFSIKTEINEDLGPQVIQENDNTMKVFMSSTEMNVVYSNGKENYTFKSNSNQTFFHELIGEALGAFKEAPYTASNGHTYYEASKHVPIQVDNLYNRIQNIPGYRTGEGHGGPFNANLIKLIPAYLTK
jgi:hypothetical protein